MGQRYRQFSVEERCEIARLSSEGVSIRQIAAGHRIFVGLRTGRYRNNGASIGHSVHRILSVIQESIPAIEFAPEHAHWFEQGPGTVEAGIFKPFENVPLFDPSDVLEIYKSGQVLLAAIPNIEPRRVFRRLFRLSHAAMAGSSSMA